MEYDTGKTCATCAGNCNRDEDDPCGTCLAVEMQTKRPFTRWRPKQK